MFLLFAQVVFAAQTAVVVVEGAMVYKKADFDSPVIGYLPRGKQVRVSDKNFGPFHRVHFREGVVGYISDVDIARKDGTLFSTINSGQTDSKSPKKTKKKVLAPKPKRPVASSTSAGPAVGHFSYRELVNRREYSDGISPLGIRFSTRAPFLNGPYGLDITLLLLSSPPKYFDQIADRARGNYWFLDAIFTFPMAEVTGKDFMVVAGIGPLLTHSEVTGTVGGQAFKQKDTVIGAAVQFGLAYRLSPIILKTDVKYFLERSSYVGFLGSLQYEF